MAQRNETDLLRLDMSELAPIGHFMSRIPFERFPTLESSGGTNDLGCELNFSVERGGSVDGQELGSVLDKWGRDEMGIDLSSES